MKLVLTTIDSREAAESLARSIVTERLAACVNIIDQVRSVYWWEDEVQHAEEMILLIKTTPEHLDNLEQFIREHHPYDLPEYIVLEPASVSNEYLEWVRSSTR